MLFTELIDLPVECTQLTPHVWGEGTPGASLSFKAVVRADDVEIVENGLDQLQLWGEDDGVSVLSRIMNGTPFEFHDLELPVRINSSNGGDLLSFVASKMSINKAVPKANKMIEYGFSISWSNEADDLYAGQLCMKRKDLSLSTGKTDQSGK